VPSGTKFEHPGAIVDAYTRKGLAAEAYAYGSQGAKEDSGCPVYDALLDSQKSQVGTGNFTFRIDEAKSGYLAVYCKAGHAARTETTNDNSKEGTRVQPDPVTLYPTSPSAGIPVQIATAAISTDLKRLRADFSYYGQASPKAFAEGSSKFSESDRQVILNLMRNRDSSETREPSVGEWGELKSIESPAVAFQVISKELNHARSDFIYYAQADEKAYSDALRKNLYKEAETIEAIRKRARPFGGRD
jgi:hypothetical protein